MSDFFDDSHVTSVGLEGSAGPSVSMWDMVQQGFRQQYRVDSQFALDQELDNRWRESLRASGQTLNSTGNAYLMREYAQFVRDGTVPSAGRMVLSQQAETMGEATIEPGASAGFEEMRRANEAIRQLNNPQIRTFEQILEEVSQMQRGVEEETGSMSERGGALGVVGELLGAIGGSFTLRDPLNIITAPIGAGRTVATRIAAEMGIAATVVTATELGDVAPNRALAGLPERDPLFNIAAATLGAGLIRGGIEGIGYGVRRARERFSGEEIDFDLRDSQLQQMFADNADRPTARAAASLLDDTVFIERNNPYGEGRAASERFMAELRAVQRSMNGEPMTAIARVLPPVPFEYIQKATDFEIVREQAPSVYARMEQAQVKLASFRESTEPVSLEELRVDGNERFLTYTASNGERADVRLVIGQDGKTEVEVNANTASYRHPRKVGVAEVRRVSEALKEKYPEITEFFGKRETGSGVGRVQVVAARRSANAEYQAAYRAVETEAVRLREQQTRVKTMQQRESSNILATVSEGRPFVGPLLRYDSVESLVDRINTINDTLDEKAVAAFVRTASLDDKAVRERSAPRSAPEARSSDEAPRSNALALNEAVPEVERARRAYEAATADVERARAEGADPEQRLKLVFEQGERQAEYLKTAQEARDNRWHDLMEKLRQRRLGDEVGTTPHSKEGVWQTTDVGGVIADEQGRPVVFKNAKIAARWAVSNRMAGDFEPANWRTNSDEAVLRRRDASRYGLIDSAEPTGAQEIWLTEDGRVDIGLREPVDPDFRIATDDGDMSVADIMRDLQDDVDLVDAIRVCAV